uniref:Uncharacterized protein n=1 Tax=Crocodylus porosus TaxID=8502 RepID=A0A7M4EWB2_CROPO
MGNYRKMRNKVLKAREKAYNLKAKLAVFKLYQISLAFFLNHLPCMNFILCKCPINQKLLETSHFSLEAWVWMPPSFACPQLYGPKKQAREESPIFIKWE